MRRYLLMTLWPAAEAAIVAATVSAARRAPRSGVSGAESTVRSMLGDGATSSAAPHAVTNGARRLGSFLADSISHGQGRRQAARWLPDAAAEADWVPGLIKLAAVSCAGGALSYGVMTLLGPTVLNRGPAIDEPLARWTADHQVGRWAAVMERLGKIGNTWTTWGAAGTAAVCLSMTWPNHKWLPPAVLGAAVLVDHYTTLAIRHKFGRIGPPDSPLGTYPSGGCDRVVLFYGLIAYMLCREFSGHRGKACAIGTVAALSFNEAYSRQYLGKHWFTDIVSGLLYGAVLLVPFMVAVRLIAGPAN